MGNEAGPHVGILGGTGDQGRGLALRLAISGLEVTIGSRNVERAVDVADGLGRDVRGASNQDCAATADVVIVAVPYDGHAALLHTVRTELTGKVVIYCVNPLGFDKQGPYALVVPEGSAAQQAQQILPESTVVGAFHHVSAQLLLDLDVATLDTDVLVLGDVRDATDQVQALADRLPGMRGVYGGRLRNAGQVEALTANLIAVNRRYKTHSGIRLTGLT